MNEKMKELYKKIDMLSEAYYDFDNPLATDAEYDALMRELLAYEEKYPEFRRKNSQTIKIGGTAKFSPTKHKHKMESLKDVFSKEEVLDFLQKTDNTEYVLEYKIDGLSISLEYENGKLIRALTRGDGETGENITENALNIEEIPKKIADTRNIILRGEVYMKISVFNELNEKRKLNDETLFKNPRNAAAGSLRQLDSTIVADRKLSFFCFNVENAQSLGFDRHIEALNYIKSLDVPVSLNLEILTEFNQISNALDTLYEKSKELDFLIDGAVLKVNNLSKRAKLGSTSKFPKWALAYKYPAKIEETQVLDIMISVGRTGVLTPNAVLEPVFVSGTTVSRATLHNKDFIENLGLCIGDYVNIRKAGEIIPEVVSVNLSKRPYDAKPFLMPDNCPVCNHTVFYDDSEVALRCINPMCPAILLESINHFVSRNAQNIEGISSKTIETLINNNLIFDAGDLYYLKEEDILALDRFAKTSADNLLREIEKSKQNQLERLLFGLGIRHVGQKASKILANYFGNLDNLFSASVDEITNIHEIGEKTAKSLLDWYSLDTSKALIEKLRAKNVNFVQEIQAKSDKFSGQTFVLTGTLEKFTRKEASDMIEQEGGKVSSSVSKKTSYVVYGEEAGSKLEKAQRLGIKLLTEDEFLKLLGE